MTMRTCLFLLVLILARGVVSAQGQGWSQSSGNDTLYTLDGDTLRTNAGFQFYVGQKLVVGKGSGENGWYYSIGFRSANAWPLLLFHDLEMNNEYKYQNDGEQARENDKVRSSLDSGQIAVVTKIRKAGGKKHGYWYWVLFKAKGSPGVRFRCNIGAAIRTKEILLPEVADPGQ